MSNNFYRHIVAGDRLVIRFRYHYDQPDLRFKILELKEKLVGTGLLAEVEGFKIISDDYPHYSKKDQILYVRGEDVSEDDRAFKVTFDTIEERNEALKNLVIATDKVNGLTPGISVPPVCGGNQNFGGNKSMFPFNIKKNTLATNLLDAQLIVEVPGVGKGAINVARPADKNYLLVTITKDGKELGPFNFPLADSKVDKINGTVDNGIFTLDVKYNLGEAIEIA